MGRNDIKSLEILERLKDSTRLEKYVEEETSDDPSKQFVNLTFADWIKEYGYKYNFEEGKYVYPIYEQPKPIVDILRHSIKIGEETFNIIFEFSIEAQNKEILRYDIVKHDNCNKNYHRLEKGETNVSFDYLKDMVRYLPTAIIIRNLLKTQHIAKAQNIKWTGVNHWEVEIRRQWDKYYALYLQSPEWQELRHAVLERADNKCEMPSCAKPAKDVHHTTYINVGKEDLDDLLAVCRECHKEIHRHMNNKTGWIEKIEKLEDRLERHNLTVRQTEQAMRKRYSLSSTGSPDQYQDVMIHSSLDAALDNDTCLSGFCKVAKDYIKVA